MLGVQTGIQYYISISDLLVKNAFSISLLPLPLLWLHPGFNKLVFTTTKAQQCHRQGKGRVLIKINISKIIKLPSTSSSVSSIMNLFQRGIFFRICSASQFGSVSCRAFFSSFSFCTLIQDNMESMKESGQGSMMNRIDRIYLQLVFNCLTLFKRALPSIDILSASPITLV